MQYIASSLSCLCTILHLKSNCKYFDSRAFVDLASALKSFQSTLAAAIIDIIASKFAREETILTTLTVRNIEPAIKDKLRRVAAANGRSMEEEVRSILRNALAKPTLSNGLGSRIHKRFQALGGIELSIPERNELIRGAQFDETSQP
jgi:antitoxin FitA